MIDALNPSPGPPPLRLPRIDVSTSWLDEVISREEQRRLRSLIDPALPRVRVYVLRYIGVGVLGS